MPNRRVVVTGLGAMTPLGGDVASTWDAMLAGASGAVLLTDDWVADMPSKVACPAAVDPTTRLDRVKARRMDRTAQFAVAAAQEAWDDAGLADAEVDHDRMGAAVATGIGGLDTTLTNYDKLQVSPRRVSPLAIPMLMPNSSVAHVSLTFGARAGAHSPVSACASSNEAIAFALDQIRLGRADVMIAGGTEACIQALPMAAFGQMQAMSRRNDDPQRASRPWDVDRDGFVLGEGAGILILESEEHAQARGAKVYAVLAGAGMSADAKDIVLNDPPGAIRAMEKCLAEAELSAGDIRHVNAHATSTPQGDTSEASAIEKVLPDVGAVVATGTKSMTGHLLGAAGAVESMATVLALHHRKVPPTINLDEQDPDVHLDIATSVRDLPDGDLAALNNSFGFGGHNVTIAFTTA